MRFIGLKASSIGLLSVDRADVFTSMKGVRVTFLGSGRVVASSRGLELSLTSALGVKLLAAGLGRNSVAHTLNLDDAAELGVGTALGGPGIGPGGGMRTFCIGIGGGAFIIPTPALCCCCDIASL